MKRCSKCNDRKAAFLFPINRQTVNGHSAICKKCENSRQKIARDMAKGWKYPYKGFNDPQYLKDRAKCFAIQAKRSRKDMGLNW